MKLHLCVAKSKVPNRPRPRNRENDNDVEDEYEIWHELNPFPANLIKNQKVSSTIRRAAPRPEAVLVCNFMKTAEMIRLTSGNLNKFNLYNDKLAGFN
jgi:hypothetical protein